MPVSPRAASARSVGRLLVRVALTKGTLLVPPTYFALAHALAMPELRLAGVHAGGARQ